MLSSVSVCGSNTPYSTLKLLWLAETDSPVRFDDTSQTLERQPSRNAYWSRWYAFYPHTDIYTP